MSFIILCMQNELDSHLISLGGLRAGFRIRDTSFPVYLNDLQYISLLSLLDLPMYIESRQVAAGSER